MDTGFVGTQGHRDGGRGEEIGYVRVETLGTWGCGNGCGDMDMGFVGTRGHRDGGEVRKAGTWRHGDMRVERLGTWGNGCGDMGLVGTQGLWDTEMGGEIRTVGDMGTRRHEGGEVGTWGQDL